MGQCACINSDLKFKETRWSIRDLMFPWQSVTRMSRPRSHPHFIQHSERGQDEFKAAKKTFSPF